MQYLVFIVIVVLYLPYKGDCSSLFAIFERQAVEVIYPPRKTRLQLYDEEII